MGLFEILIIDFCKNVYIIDDICIEELSDYWFLRYKRF